MKKVAVVLSGCGFKDGAEITESVSTLIALSDLGVDYQVFAPDTQVPSTNHLTGTPQEARNVLAESARIARGKIKNVKDLDPADYDALVFPGGYGAATVLCGFAKAGAKCDVNPEIKRTIEEFYAREKPIAAICIAPALIARVLGERGITVTIGNDKDTAAEIAKTGARHESCPVEDYVTDREHKIVTTPAYMYDDAKPNQVFKGIRGALKELVEMA
jgi:enhancing lycopene biosynthesis protein 2